MEPKTKSHAPVEEHDESFVPKRQKGQLATHCWPSPGSPEYTVGCPGCDGLSYRHLLKCQQKRTELGFSASSSLRNGDVVMEEAPPPPPPAEPPPVLRTSDETDAMTLAAVHPYGHEEPLEISRTEFESFVRDGFYFEEDSFELDLMKSFPVYQAVPRAEVTGKVWSTRWCYRKKGPKQVRARFVVRHFANSLCANLCNSTHQSVVSQASVERPPFCSVTLVLGIFSYTPEPHVAICPIFVHPLFPVFEPQIQKWVIFVRRRPCVFDTFRFESPPLRGKKIEFGTDHDN